MKTKLHGQWLVGGLALVLPWLSGCGQESARAALGEGATNAAPAPAVAVTNAVTLAEAGATNAAVTNFPVLPEPPEDARPIVPDAEAAQARPLPPGLLASPSFTQVVRMANAGVDPRVLMSFITNSAGTFNLGADQIIYLKDIGLSHEVIATMIEHDLAISSGKFQVTASTVPAPAPAAANPTPPVTGAQIQPSVWQAQTAAAAPAENTYAPAPAAADAPPPPAGEAVQAAPQPAGVVNNNYFYQTLSPYGNWVNVDGYGQVWQPTVAVVDTSWRPYMNGGRWLYTDAGWYWNSDYAWGCTFQYGRWFYQPTYGWCWWPNTVWGPSWVTWRSSPGYCGWAPLPPYSGWTAGVGFTWYGSGVSVGFGFNYGCNYYNWVPYRGVCSATPYRYRVPQGQARALHGQSTVINNLIIGDNNTIINRGVDVNHVSRYAGQPVPRGTVRETPHANGGSFRGDRVQREGGQYVIERPTGGPAARGTLASSRQATPAATALPSRQPATITAPAANHNPTAAGPGRAPATQGTTVGAASRNASPRDPATRPNPVPTTAANSANPTKAPADRVAARGPTARAQEAATPGIPTRTLPGRTDAPNAAQRPVNPITDPAPATRPSYGAPTTPAPAARQAYTPPTAPAPAARPAYTPPTVAMNQPAVAPRQAYTPPAAPTPVARPAYTPPTAPAPISRPSYTPPVVPSAPSPSFQASPAPTPSARPAPSTGGGGGGRGSRNPGDR